MKFFIPNENDPEKAEELYQATKKFVAQTMGCPIGDRRVRSITFRDGGYIVQALVGRPEPRRGGIVIAIFESESYLVCTPDRGVLKGEPLVVGKHEVTDSEDFERSGEPTQGVEAPAGRSIRVLGVPHRLQGPGFRDYVADPSYRHWVEDYMRAGVDIVFEEAAGRKPSIVADLASDLSANSKPIRYVDIDPAENERRKYGITTESANGAPVDPLDSDDFYESPYISENINRENLWLKRILEEQFEKGLVVCGLAHTLSFAYRLHAAEINVVEACTYIPHGKLCKRQHAD